MKVCHMTSVHDQDDDRIFFKECLSLVEEGFDVYEVAKGESCEKYGVKIIGVGCNDHNRLKRMLKCARAVYKNALALDCDIYHFHDPELLPYGLKLKKIGKKVIYDTHEDVPAQIKDKDWIPKFLRKTVSKCYQKYESYVVKRLDGVVGATGFIADKFVHRAKKVIAINNYPKLEDVRLSKTPFQDRSRIICYAGGIDENRGEKIMIQAMKQLSGKLIIAGKHDKKSLYNGKIEYTGKLSREQINSLYDSSVVGLCILKPIENYLHSQPIKMFEYMAAGIPFVCSDFPTWKKIVEESESGICVNPNDEEAIIKSIESLLDNRDMAHKMGLNGYEYIVKKYNWNIEARKLINFYKGLC